LRETNAPIPYCRYCTLCRTICLQKPQRRGSCKNCVSCL
jgi:hypothetical protein